mgnify:CR=1 FL=1
MTDVTQKFATHVPTPEEILELVALARNATSSWQLLTRNGRTENPPRVGFTSDDGFNSVVATFPARTWAGVHMPLNDAEFVAAANPYMILGLCERLRQLEFQLVEAQSKKMVFPATVSWWEDEYLAECIEVCMAQGIPFSTTNQSTQREDS